MIGYPTSALTSLDRHMNFALVVLWTLVLTRTGFVAAGYALLALLADVQTLIGPPLPQTFHTRHPYGLLVELSAAGLRHAWWIEPHLDHARRMFVLGAAGSLLLWLLKMLVGFRRRLRVDPVFAARIDEMFERGEVWVSRRLRAPRRRVADGLVRMVGRGMQVGALVATIVTVDRLRSSSREARRGERQLSGPAADRQGDDLPEDLLDGIGSVNPSQSDPCEEAPENDSTRLFDEQRPTSPAAPHPSSFFTRF